MNEEKSNKDRGEDPALAYLGELEDETMTLAWGPGRSPEDRRRIVAAALIFGRQFEERMEERPPESMEEQHFRRFLMDLMNAVISEFAEREGLSQAEAAEFLGDVSTRDHVLEFNEVLEASAEDPDKTLDEQLRAAVEGRGEKARWADHWSSG